MNFVNYKLLPITKRILKSFIDLVLLFGVGITLYFSLFNIPFNTKAETDLRLNAFIESGLYIENENRTYSMIDSSDYLAYQSVVRNYYTGKVNDEDPGGNSYFESAFYQENNGARKALTIEEYNEQILGLKTDQPNDYFTFVVIEEVPQTDKFGVLKDELFHIVDGKKVLKENEAELIYRFFRDQYLSCFEDLHNDGFYLTAINNQTNKEKLRTFTSFIVPSFLFYLMIPLMINNTLGEKICGGKLVRVDGVKVSRLRYIVRYLPQALLVCTTLISEMIYIPIIAVGLYLIADMILINLSKNYCSIPDRISKTCLIDIKHSTIFETIEEKEKHDKELLSSLEKVSEEYYEKENEANDG